MENGNNDGNSQLTYEIPSRYGTGEAGDWGVCADASIFRQPGAIGAAYYSTGFCGFAYVQHSSMCMGSAMTMLHFGFDWA